MKAGYGGARRGQAEIEATAVLCTGQRGEICWRWMGKGKEQEGRD